jgi:hypothetical protein
MLYIGNSSSEAQGYTTAYSNQVTAKKLQEEGHPLEKPHKFSKPTISKLKKKKYVAKYREFIKFNELSEG